MSNFLFSRTRQHTAFFDYGLAAGAILTTVALKYLVEPWLPIEEGAFLFFSGGVLVVAVFARIATTILATVLWLFIGLYWAAIGDGVGLNDTVRASYFTLHALLVGWGAQRLREMRAQQAEIEVLHVADERVRALLEAAPDAMVIVDNSRQIVLVNAQAERLFGYHRQELLGKPIEVLIPTRFHANHRVQAQQFIEHPTTRAMGAHNASALWGLRRDGSEFPVEVSLSPIVSGTEHLVASAIRDITARRQIETRREEQSEGRWKFLAESVPSIVWTSNSQGLTTFISARWKELTGMPFILEDPTFSWGSALHPDDAEDIATAWGHCIDSGEPFAREYRIRRRDGVYRWFTAQAIPRRDAATGEIVEWCGAITDIHGLREAQERVEGALRHLSAIIDTVPVGIVTLDDEGTVLTWNDAAERILGWTAEDVIGKRAPHIPSSMFESGEWTALIKANQVGHGLQGQECIRISKAGQEVPVSMWSLAVTREGKSQNLHMLLDERDKKKFEEQLRQAAKMEAIGRLAGGVAHDFNNMLQIINGYSQMLLGASGGLNAEQESYLSEITRAGDRAAELTADLLKFSRQQVAQPKVLDLNTELGELRNMISRLLTEGIRLDLNLSPEAGRIRIDKSQLSQIIFNLVANARDAMPVGGRLMIETGAVNITETFRTHHADLRSGRYTLVTVTDTGEGMSPEVREKIFEPFFTTKKEPSHTLGGTGLGLATVYGIVKQNEGGIYVYSELGRGTTFKIYLPQTTVEESEPSSQPAGITNHTAGERILIVEDEDSVRRLIRTILSDAGYQATDTGDVNQALVYALENRNSIDLLLTDLVMPNCNGRELATQIQVSQSHMKVLFMSGFPGSAVVQQGILDPDMEFIAKPFSADQLRERVRAVLDGLASL